MPATSTCRDSRARRSSTPLAPARRSLHLAVLARAHREEGLLREERFDGNARGQRRRIAAAALGAAGGALLVRCLA